MARVRKSQEAFTLIELMMIVSIISFLTVLMMPTVSKARDKGTTLRCISQQRQIWEGVQRYEMDFRTTLFTIRNDGVAIRNTLVNAQYAKSAKVFECPSSTIVDNDDITLTYVSGTVDFLNTYCSMSPVLHLLK